MSTSRRTFLLVSSLMVILVGLIGLTAQTRYSYSSRASEDPQGVTIASMSYTIQEAPSDTYPSCIAHLSYVPPLDNSTDVCFVQFECKDAVADVQQLASHSCTSNDSRKVSCDNPKGCSSVSEWMSYAGKVCGC